MNWFRRLVRRINLFGFVIDFNPPAEAVSTTSTALAAKAPAGAGYDLDDILERLERHRQRATYGAVAGLLGRQPLTLFDGYDFTPKWFIRQVTGRPARRRFPVAAGAGGVGVAPSGTGGG